MFDEEHVIYRYKYLPYSDCSLKTLTEGTIKFTCPLEFNDPFDCLPHYEPTSIEKALDRRPDLFKAAGDRMGLSPAQRLERKGEFVTRLRRRVNQGTFGRDLVANIGVVTLSRNALSIPMWSHYADFHRGFVLELRTPTMGDRVDLAASTDRLLPYPVVYNEVRPQIQLGVEDRQRLVEMCLLTKSTDWQYEEEERVIDQARGPGIRQYRRDDILASVIAGMRMPEEHFRNLSHIVGTLRSKIPMFGLYRASIVTGEFKLEVKAHPRLQGSPP